MVHRSLSSGLLILFFLYFGFALNAQAKDGLSEDKKIEELFQFVDSSDVAFIRNGTEYKPHEASTHLRKKLKSAQSSFFAPKEKDWTARLFIKKVASTSSISGQPYLIRLPNNKVISADAWLTGKLTKLEATDK